jgi:hypothetical protein
MTTAAATAARIHRRTLRAALERAMGHLAATPGANL